jgi:hypothetical protein
MTALRLELSGFMFTFAALRPGSSSADRVESSTVSSMDQESLRLLIQHKIRDRRLPHDGIRTVSSTPSDGETCDACDTVLTKDQLLMEGLTLDLGGRPFKFHVRCFQIWDHERRAA